MNFDRKFRHSVGEIWFDHAGNECFYREDGSISCRTVNDDESLAIQSERDRCDLNIIKAIYDKTGVMNNVRTDTPRYGDFTSSRELHDVLLRAQEANEEFMTLDAHIRARFDNDPGKLLDFVYDPKNAAEAIELGLIMAPDASPQTSQVSQGEESTPSNEGV